MFGRRKKNAPRDDESRRDLVDEEYLAEAGDGEESAAENDYADEDDYADEYEGVPPPDGGPYDFEDLDADADPAVGARWNRLDLGSVYVPMPEGSQLQVEMAQDGTPQAVHVVTEHGRVTVAAYAAPKSPGQWREVAADLAESLRGDQASVAVENGPWGREVFAVTANADLRFIGIDGYRWMIRCVVAGPRDGVGPESPVVATARDILLDTVVKRGDEPQPARTPLPVVLPAALAQQLAAAHEQQLAARQQQAAAQQNGGQTQPPAASPAGAATPQAGTPQPEAPQPETPQAPSSPTSPNQASPNQEQQRRRGSGGSAMQQLGG
ncbi:DUF3710 domain-containing protein [Rhodococcus triatomae]|uniref:DUF3710 domain-containing protein n=1 Tax=Rhodococcus triatomae TaxID=300028 RepID=A0A1G8MNW3_9NOCA|nr:DUF3710 domain-containing protein [Rhodococcus triatomae]QNG19050.1 DUF3710 domain-containing protein [Rhodococcus triatomae]QNG25037.1 DUF3710 domain-containing protein [Rhodococcus triatomae]SDI69719.1 Protein of unknown function [Rhodococcus triatomae]